MTCCVRDECKGFRQKSAVLTSNTPAPCAGYKAVTAACIVRAATSHVEVLENKMLASADVTISGQVGKDEAHLVRLPESVLSGLRTISRV